MRVAMKALFSKAERFLIKQNQSFLINLKENYDKSEKSSDEKINELVEKFENELTNKIFKSLLFDTGLPLEPEIREDTEVIITNEPINSSFSLKKKDSHTGSLRQKQS